MTGMVDLAADVLAECELLLDPNVTGRSLPARRYVSHGQPPVEFCDGLLSVWYPTMETRQIGDSDAGQTQRVVELAVDVWRCWPVGDERIPDAEVLSKAAGVAADDLDRLSLGLSSYLAPRCGVVGWRPALSLGPSGGMAGWRLGVRLSL